MSVVKNALSARTVLASAAAALNNLANGTYVVLGTITHSSGGKTPLDCLVELAVTPGTVASNKQVVLFAQASLDGVNWSTGPTSLAVTTDESVLNQVGTLPTPTNAALQRRVFSLAAAFGSLPFATRMIAKNESGAALAAAGNDVYTADQTGDIT